MGRACELMQVTCDSHDLSFSVNWCGVMILRAIYNQTLISVGLMATLAAN
jgi:hypothetical protein